MGRIFLVLILPVFLFSPYLAEGGPPGQDYPQRAFTAGIPSKENHNAVPKVAIIIDDLGLDLTIVHSFLDLDIPLAFSILPQLTYSQEIAELVHSRNLDVLFHIPMEPYQYPKINAGVYSLLATMGPQTLEKTLKAGLKSIPYVTGANNHMGSKLTENEGAMRTVLGCLKDLNLFFVDSVTSHKSKAYGIAREMGVRTAKRNIFLDNWRERNFIAGQFLQLKRSALAAGSSIGIGHPNRATLSMLREMIPKFEEAGIRFVSVSELVR